MTDTNAAPAFANAPKPIAPPRGHVWLARRMNHHPYHLTSAASKENVAMCGAEGQSMDYRMKHLIADHADKACPDCLLAAVSLKGGGRT